MFSETHKARELSPGLINKYNFFQCRTNDLIPHFRITTAAPYRAVTLSQADSTFNLTLVRVFEASVLT